VPDHPDHEQLAAFQAGDGDRRQLADLQAHLAGCPSCAEVVASVERARRRLALLEEPDLPPGLHDRLAAALDTEAARAPVERPVSRFGRAAPRAGTDRAPAGAGSPRSMARPRPAPWYRRRVAWGAAAALLLAALVAVPLLDRSSDLSTAGGAGGGQAAQDLASPEAAGTVLVIRVPGEVSAATVRARLASDTRAKAALAAAGARGAQAAPPGGSGGAAGATQTPGGSGGTGGATQSPAQPGGGTGTGAAASGAGPAALRSCLSAATAAATPATRPLAPAFLLEGRYRGREATVLVTASTGQPGRVDLWVFPRGTCSGPPLATERVR
jgi:hypothetical protein